MLHWLQSQNSCTWRNFNARCTTDKLAATYNSAGIQLYPRYGYLRDVQEVPKAYTDVVPYIYQIIRGGSWHYYRLSVHCVGKHTKDNWGEVSTIGERFRCDCMETWKRGRRTLELKAVISIRGTFATGPCVQNRGLSASKLMILQSGEPGLKVH